MQALAALALILTVTSAAAQAPFLLRLEHRSALERSLPVSDPDAIAWSESNALVRRLGGHAGHLRSPPVREASPPGAVACAPPACGPATAARPRTAHEALAAWPPPAFPSALGVRP